MIAKTKKSFTIATRNESDYKILAFADNWSKIFTGKVKIGESGSNTNISANYPLAVVTRDLWRYEDIQLELKYGGKVTTQVTGLLKVEFSDKNIRDNILKDRKIRISTRVFDCTLVSSTTSSPVF